MSAAAASVASGGGANPPFRELRRGTIYCSKHQKTLYIAGNLVPHLIMRHRRLAYLLLASAFWSHVLDRPFAGGGWESIRQQYGAEGLGETDE